ncbi:hypothetical protein B0I35DRAFT_424646 [Stachybotrys elegans]|uniref:Galactose oxidase n=1 Tax=Stachybotrys elegans TaxID=80388 RepID=A0A8K0T2V4_9HYPO|nr:hypothetical protein B0I35DRAFT_424646 [Stachybotrys elegans]
MDQPTLYTYGGMCASPDDDTTSWQSAGNYTKTMMSLAPTHSDRDTNYDLSVASSSGPRTPIAGFTLTALTPSMTNRSGTVTQQASFVLLGGHTSTAFINMSTAAVWNLPEESWTYVDIQSPDEQGTTELAVKNEDKRLVHENIDSRSGHTAVLSEDGSRLIVYGGWVGDVGTPAEPQLAVLEMSQAYSGWRWMVPEQQPDSDSLYGHGAAVLPGDVMVVYGGWPVVSSNTKTKRQNGLGSPRFFNLTSMEWTTTYTNPSFRPGSSTGNPGGNAGEDSDEASTGTPGSSRRTLALGLGLGIGLALLLAAIMALSCWYMQKRKQRESREKMVRALSQDANQFIHDTDEMTERTDFLPWSSRQWYGGREDPFQSGGRSLGFESLRGSRGHGFGGPPPLSGLGNARRNAAKGSRGSYMPAASHPGDDEEETHIHNIRDHPRSGLHDPSTPTSDVPSDPFMTPVGPNPPAIVLPAPSRGTSSPENMRRHDPEVQDWVSDVDAADALLARMNGRSGRGSPTRPGSYRSALRDDESRSGSTLSDSNRSIVDSLRQSPSIRRANPAGSSSLLGGSTLIGGSEQVKPGSSSSSSYTTARSSFNALQAEGPSLLGRGHPTSPTYEEDDIVPMPGSPSKSKPRRNWLGSLRRVFSTSGTPSSESSKEDMPSRRSLDNEHDGGDYEAPLVGLSGELLRRKQGRHDWESTGPGGSNEKEPETDWDIERAVEQRLVQVVFTVPKERLRVVNADEVDGLGDESHIAEVVDAAPLSPELREPRTPIRQEMREDRHSPFPETPDKHDMDRLSRVDTMEYRMSTESKAPVLMTAEAITVKTLSRPKSRVLQMVDTIESRSQEGSREGSPTRRS